MRGANTRITLNRHRTWRKNFSPCLPKQKQFISDAGHELKTPLMSISGYAEIIENGMVRPEDIQNFAGRIHAEASRLSELVEDIIRLSRLDEAESDDEHSQDAYEADFVQQTQAVLPQVRSADIQNWSARPRCQTGTASHSPALVLRRIAAPSFRKCTLIGTF